MGLFSRKKTVYGTSVVRVMEGKGIPDSEKSGLLRGIFEHANADIDDYVLEEFVQSMAITADRYHWYGKNRYTRGLPKCTRISRVSGLAEVTAVLNGLEGASVSASYSVIGAPNLQHRAWMHLISSYGYSQTTNILSTLGSPPRYLEHFQLVLPVAEMDEYTSAVLEMYGPETDAGYAPDRRVGQLPNTLVDGDNQPIQYSSVGTETIKLRTRHMISGVPVFTNTTFTLPAIDENATYIHVRYVVGGVIKFWMYKLGDGTYPTLDALLDDPITLDSGYMPIAYFRREKSSLVANESTTVFKSTKRMLDIIGLDFKSLGDSIHDNPDIADIDSAMLMFAINAESTNKAALHYLFDYFTQWFTDAGGAFDSAPSTHWIDPGAEFLQDGYSKTASSVDNITRTIIAGSIGAIGAYTTAVENTTEFYTYLDEYDMPQSKSVGVVWHKYRHQISATEYCEVAVKNLMVYYYIGTAIVRASSTDQNILVPIDRNIVSNYTLQEREQVYCRSLHLVCNCVTVIKLKWYETGIFRFVMTAIALVITVISIGKSWKLLMLALAIGGLSYALAVVLINLVLQWARYQLLRLFIKAVGLEAALVVAFIAAVYSGQVLATNGGMLGTPWAADMLSLSTNLAQVTGEYSRDMIQDVQGQAAQQENQNRELWEKLEKAQELLDTETRWMIPIIIPNETPESFFARTVHSGNIGAVGITAIQSYVDNALTLPTLDQTIGGFKYGRLT